MTPDPTPDPTRDPGPEETTDAVDPHPAVDDLVISPAGLGPLVFGVPLEDNPGAAMLEHDPDHCSSPALEDAGDPVRWVAAYEPVLEFDHYGGDELHAPFYVHVDADDSMVKRIDLWTDRIATSGGIRLGSSLAALQAAHPGVVEETEADDWSRAWVLRSDAGTLVFETIDQGVEGTDLVVGIRAYGPGVDPDLHTTGTDDVAGGCL